MASTPVVVCRDCQHLLAVRVKISHSYDSARCGAEENKLGINLVTGDTLYKDPLCTTQRNSSNPSLCGPSGRWFKLYIKPVDTYAVGNTVYPKTSAQKKSAGLDFGMES